MLGRAITLAARLFEKKKDRGGHSYMLHCIRVMMSVRHLGENTMIVAILHDVVEDTRITINDLIKNGYEHEIIASIILLTHQPGIPYEFYIQEIRGNKMARAVKIADLRDNSDITRLKGIRDKDLERMKKYHTSYITLTTNE